MKAVWRKLSLRVRATILVVATEVLIAAIVGPSVPLAIHAGFGSLLGMAGLALILIAVVIHPKPDKRFRSGFRDVTKDGYVYNPHTQSAERMFGQGARLICYAMVVYVAVLPALAVGDFLHGESATEPVATTTDDSSRAFSNETFAAPPEMDATVAKDSLHSGERIRWLAFISVQDGRSRRYVFDARESRITEVTAVITAAYDVMPNGTRLFDVDNGNLVRIVDETQYSIPFRPRIATWFDAHHILLLNDEDSTLPGFLFTLSTHALTPADQIPGSVEQVSVAPGTGVVCFVSGGTVRFLVDEETFEWPGISKNGRCGVAPDGSSAFLTSGAPLDLVELVTIEDGQVRLIGDLRIPDRISELSWFRDSNHLLALSDDMRTVSLLTIDGTTVERAQSVVLPFEVHALRGW